MTTEPTARCPWCNRPANPGRKPPLRFLDIRCAHECHRKAES